MKQCREVLGVGKGVSSKDRTGSLPLPEMGCSGSEACDGEASTQLFLSSQEMQKLETNARGLQISIPMTSQSRHVGLDFQGSVKMTFGLSLVRGCDDSSRRSKKAQGDGSPGRRAGQRQEKMTEGRKVHIGTPGEPGSLPLGLSCESSG